MKVILACLATCCALSGARASAQLVPGLDDPVPATPTVVEDEFDLDAAIASASAELEARRADLATADPETDRASALQREVQLLTGLVSAYQQASSAREIANGFGADEADLEARHQRLIAEGPADPPPWTFELVESARNELARVLQRSEGLERSVEDARSQRDAAITARDEKASSRRLARDAVERASGDEDRAAAESLLYYAELEARAAEARLLSAEAKLGTAEAELRVHLIRRRFLGDRVRALEQATTFTEEELGLILAEIDREVDDLESELATARLDLDGGQERFNAALARTQAGKAEGDPVAEAEYESYRAERLYFLELIELLTARLERQNALRTLWERRYAIANDEASADELVEWRAEAEGSRASIERDVEVQEDELADQRDLQDELDAVLDDPTTSPELKRWVRGRRNQVRNLAEAHRDELDDLRSVLYLYERLCSELAASTDSSSIGYWLARSWGWVVTVWNYEITSVQDNPITIGKILFGLILLTLGTRLARKASRSIGRWVLTRFGMDEGASHALQSILFYILVITLGLFALRVVNVPLTAFTVLGGAIAIGVGFGSQNIVNNFISGLILLVERPISVGDMVQVGSLFCTVEHIGARSTRVRTGSNVEVIVPNSSFLESDVVNWTLTDDRIRASVNVGVAYGSPVRDVARIMQKAVDDHGKVLKSPEKPFVLFDEFGDNALVFSVHFWIRMRREMDRKRIESDVRFLIEGRFREAGIVIAFPQRDVHLDSDKPLRIELSRASASGESD